MTIRLTLCGLLMIANSHNQRKDEEKRKRVYAIALVEDRIDQVIGNGRMEGETSSFGLELFVSDLARQQRQVQCLLQHQPVVEFFPGA